MTITLAAFEASPIPPMPTARELQALAVLGANAAKADRVTIMNAIGQVLGVPAAGWPGGQSRLFDHGDVRVVWLLRRMARESLSKAVAKNIERVARFVDADAMLTIAVAAREHSSSIGEVSTTPIDSWHEGGLDFLWQQKDKLGLPDSVTREWRPIAPFRSPETNNMVYPAMIPARDQVLAYAAQMTASYRNTFNRFRDWARPLGKPDSTAYRVSSLIWKAYAFLAPGGVAFDTNQSFASQKGQKFGCFTALTYVAQTPQPIAIAPNYLNAILVDANLNDLEWVRIAKARVAEALYLEHLLRTTRPLLSPAP